MIVTPTMTCIRLRTMFVQGRQNAIRNIQTLMMNSRNWGQLDEKSLLDRFSRLLHSPSSRNSLNEPFLKFRTLLSLALFILPWRRIWNRINWIPCLITLQTVNSHIVTAGKGISVTGVDFEFNAMIIGVADHLYQTFEMKYPDRIVTKIKDSTKNVLQHEGIFFWLGS